MLSLKIRKLGASLSSLPQFFRFWEDGGVLLNGRRWGVPGKGCTSVMHHWRGLVMWYGNCLFFLINALLVIASHILWDSIAATPN
jgi:hypothetical protein